jgi:tryptophan-rich sensory protein
MNRSAERIGVAILSLGLAVAAWGFGLYLLPSWSGAQERGTFAPWVVTWGMIWVTTLSAIALAAYLIFSAKKDAGPH